MAPRWALHGLHEATSGVSSPTMSKGKRWSASVAGAFLHQWHRGLPSSSSALRLLYSGLLVRLGIVCCGFLASALAALRLLSLTTYSFGFVFPTVQALSALVAGHIVEVDTIRIYDVWTLHSG